MSWLFLISLAFVAPQESAASDDEHMRETAVYYESALGRFQQAQYEQSVIQLKNALQLSPRHLPARILLGDSYLELGLLDLAEQELLLAKSMGADINRVDASLGRVFLQKGEFSRLLEEMSPEQYRAPVAAQIALLHGHAYAHLGQHYKAQWRYEMAQNLGADPIETLLGSARSYLNQGDRTQARELIVEVLRMAPRNSEARYIEAQLKQAEGDNEGAIAALDRLIDGDAEHFAALLNRAALYLDADNTDAAASDIARAEQLSPDDPRVAYLQYLLYAKRGEAQQAKMALDKAAALLAQITPESIAQTLHGLLIAGTVAFEQKRLKEAAVLLEQYLVRAPGNQDVRKRLAAIYLVESKPERVVEVLEPVLKKSPQWQILMMAGAAQYDLGNYDIASQLLQKARMLRPDNANAKWQLARVRAAQDRLPEAIDLLENLDPESPVYRHAMLFLAGLQIKSQQLDKAIANAKYLTQAEPQNHAAWDVLGSALAAAQQEAAAREAFASALRLKPGYLPVQLKLASLDILGNRLQQARERYQTILTKTPYELQVMSALAELERRAGNLDAAISVREKILEFHPDALTENLKLAELYIEADRTKKASDLIQTLEVQYRDNFDVRFARVLLEIATGKLREAKMSLRSLTTDAGYEVAKLVKIAQYQMRIGALDQAYWSLTKAADAAPDVVYLQKNLIQLELKLNKPDKALERASKLLAQDPQDAASELFVGDAQLAKGNPDAALSAYWRAHAIAPSSLTVMRLQGLMQQTGETGQALKLMQDWLQQHPDDVVVRERLGMAQIAAGRYQQALLTHEWLVRQPAPSAQLLNHTAMLYQMQQNPKAMEYAKRAYKLAPEDPYIIDTLGWTYIENGEPLLGLQYLRDALSRDAQDPTIRYHTALALTRLERYQEAQAMLTPLLAENKPFLFKTQAEELQQQLREKLAGH